MTNYNMDWDDLGRNIQDIVDRAVNSRDYQRLNQTIRQTVGRAVDLGSEAVRRAWENQQASAGAEQPVVRRQDVACLYGNTTGKTLKGILMTVGGGVLSGAVFVGGVADLVLRWMFFIPDGGFLGLGALLSVAGVCLLWRGVRNLKQVSRFKTYCRLLGDKTCCTLERLASGVGKSVRFVRREIGQMIAQGLFLEGHLDKEETRLITSHETYREFENNRLLLENRQKQAAKSEKKPVAEPQTDVQRQVQQVLNRGNAFIAQIRKCNDDIPGEEISAKIDRMENIVRRIFQRAQSHPEIVPDLQKLMDYYLPMTVKLLTAYADMDAQPVQGETILASKQEIEQTLDTLNLAFEKLLDSVFKDTALDVSSDISVLNTLLAQEGLTEDELTKMKKQKQ